MKNLYLIITLICAVLIFFLIHYNFHSVLLMSTPSICTIVVDLDEINFCEEGKKPKNKNKYANECRARDCESCSYTCRDHGVMFDSYDRLVEAHCQGNFLYNPFNDQKGKRRINRK